MNVFPEHCTGKTHQKISAAITQSRKITFTKPVHDDRQIRAEVLHTNFIVQCNISFLTTDHLAPLYRVMFPYSNITKNFRCRCIKTACILNNALHHKTKSDLVDACLKTPTFFYMWIKRLRSMKDESSLCLYFRCQNK